MNYCNARIAGLNQDWAEVIHLGKKFVYPQNAVIPHEALQGFFYLAKGIVELSYNSASGQRRIALYFGPGTVVNEARSLSGHEPGGTFTCIRPAEFYLFNKDFLDAEFISSYPHLIQSLLKSMSLKMLLHYTFVTVMGTGTRISQLCRFIHSMSIAYEYAPNFTLGITQQEVADLLGVHRATLARLVKKLKDMGIIKEFTASHVQVTNYELMEKLATQSA